MASIIQLADDIAKADAFKLLLVQTIREATAPDRIALSNQAADAVVLHAAVRACQPSPARADELHCRPGGFSEAALNEPELRDTLHVIVDELTDNALKYSAGGDIMIKVGLLGNKLITQTMHQITASAAAAWQTWLQTLTETSLDAALQARVQTNLSSPLACSAGLGLLTLMLDHRVSLGWQMTPTPSQNIKLAITASLSLCNGDYDGNQRS